MKKKLLAKSFRLKGRITELNRSKCNPPKGCYTVKIEIPLQGSKPGDNNLESFLIYAPEKDIWRLFGKDLEITITPIQKNGLHLPWLESEH